MTRRNILTILLSLSCVFGVAQGIHEDYTDRVASLPGGCALPQQAVGAAQNAEEREALEFLYAYMAWPDIADYTPQFYLDQVRTTLQARHELPWGMTVPEREWRHFVLPVRVNNEHLDAFRSTCYAELRERVKGMSMMDAVLEVNHWCHEYVTYKPSDGRTSSPLASMRTATGRCGEESTFTVSALRAIGVPARQVYTPRWAHTDDNHAWVEAWVDGKWYFLGACEPEAVLNLAWFNQPASRGMLMHTCAFGKYDGPEDKIRYTKTFTEINVTANYAQTARTWVVTEPGATVDFKIYNYGEFYTVIRAKADSEGRASILSGLGDMIAWCYTADGSRYGFKQFTAGKDNNVNIPLDHKRGDTFEMDFTIVPPMGENNLPKVTAEATALNERRKAHEDSIRTAYVATFPNEVVAQDKAHEMGIPNTEEYNVLVQKAKGNYANLFRFINKYKQAGVVLLQTLTDKDIRDFDYDVLDKQMQGINLDVLTEMPLYAQYVACPRIALEQLSAWRPALKSAFTQKQREQFCENPQLLADWINKNIQTDTDRNPRRLWLSPEKTWQFRCGDIRNKGLLFVALARTMGIMARIDEVTGKVQYIANSDVFGEEPIWAIVKFATEKETKPVQQSTLKLNYTPRQYMENPLYYSHFSFAKMENGRDELQNYPEDYTWASNFKDGARMYPGEYILVSGTRMANGSVLAHMNAFNLGENEDKAINLIMREDKTGVQVIGNFNAENLYTTDNGKSQSILSHTGRGYYVTGLIRANNEPTNHILHDIEKMRADLEAWGRPILLCFPTQEEYERFQKNRAEFTNLPSNLTFGVDADGQMAHDLFNSGIVKTEELPIVIIADTFNRIVFCSQGYTIGIGESIKQTISKL